MKIKALLVALVIGSSSTAFAAPAFEQAFEHRTLPPLGVSFLSHVVEKPAPMVLANDTHLAGRSTINVSTIRPFNKVELRSSEGRSTIDRVVVYFANGRTRTVKLDRIVDSKKSISIDLPGDSRLIKRIVVVGTSKRHASVDVFAL
jgi:hypothetical protein